MKIQKLTLTSIAAVLLAGTLYTGSVLAQVLIVEDGKANAEIILAEGSPRMTAMAALELQHYLERISGARLPLSTGPGENYPVKIYVGESPQTKKLGVTSEDLEYGAFRMVSGRDWLVLLGDDSDFSPDQVEPWARGFDDRKRALADWDKLTMESAGRQWRHPFTSIFKRWWNPKAYDSMMSERYGADNRHIWNPRNLSWSREYQGSGAGAGFWQYDEGGSLNAVYELLRSLGARWYMPGELGEVIPEKESVRIPAVNRTVVPDFPVRYWNWYNYSVLSFEDIIWGRRSGMNSTYPILGNIGYAHGHILMHSRTKMKVEHPEFYALINGVRDTSHRGFGRICYSAEGLADETVKCARFMFDRYNQPHISVWPGDAFGQCECSSCQGQSPSELVWDFVDKVARELNSSHPDRLVSCGAYAQYKPPPENIDRFTPNVAVFISNQRRPAFNDRQRWDSYWENLEDWNDKLAPGRILRVENNLYSSKWGNAGYDEEYKRLPIGFPVIAPHAMAKDMMALKGISLGESGEVSLIKSQWHAPGVDHLNLYIQSCFLWDARQDVDEILEEYYTLFYGPASREMKAAFEYAEENYEYAEANFWCYTPGPWRRRHCPDQMDLAVRNRLLEKLNKARKKAGETVYGDRIQMILDELLRGEAQ